MYRYVYIHMLYDSHPAPVDGLSHYYYIPLLDQVFIVPSTGLIGCQMVQDFWSVQKKWWEFTGLVEGKIYRTPWFLYCFNQSIYKIHQWFNMIHQCSSMLKHQLDYLSMFIMFLMKNKNLGSTTPFLNASKKGRTKTAGSNGTSSVSPGKRPWLWPILMPKHSLLMAKRILYPLVMTNRTMENHRFHWENSLFLWPFSIAILSHYQRVMRAETLKPTPLLSSTCSVVKQIESTHRCGHCARRKPAQGPPGDVCEPLGYRSSGW